MLEALQLVGATLTDDLCIKKNGMADINIPKAPYQTLAKLVRELAARAGTKRNESTRKENLGLAEIDTEASKGVYSELCEEDKMLLDIMRNGSAWNAEAAFWAT